MKAKMEEDKREEQYQHAKDRLTFEESSNLRRGTFGLGAGLVDIYAFVSGAAEEVIRVHHSPTPVE